MDIRKIIDALFAKSVENGATPGEAIAAAEKAMELVRKHNVDLSTSRASDVPINAILTEYREMPGWKGLLAIMLFCGVARFCEARACYRDPSKIKKPSVILPPAVWITGYRSDIEFAFDLFDRLYLQMTQAGIAFFAKTLPDDDNIPALVLFCHQRRSRLTGWEQKFLDDVLHRDRYEFTWKQEDKVRSIADKVKRFKRDEAAAKTFLEGWGHAAGEGLWEAISRRQGLMTPQQAESAKQKKEAINVAFEKYHGEIKKHKTAKEIENVAMFMAGREEGAKAGFGKPIGGQSAPLMIGYVGERK